MAPTFPRTELAPGLDICRLVVGLWQVADIERGGTPIDPDRGAEALAAYAAAGFDTFDMADHYGSAEDLTGRLFERIAAGTLPSLKPVAFTKWWVQGEAVGVIVRTPIRWGTLSVSGHLLGSSHQAVIHD